MAVINITSSGTYNGTWGNDTFTATGAVLETSTVTLNGKHGNDSLDISGGGDIDLLKDTLISVENIVLDSNAAFVTLDGGNEKVVMGSNADTVVLGGTGDDTFVFGAAGQEAIGGIAINAYNLTALTAAGSIVEGTGTQNQVNLTGGGVFVVGSEFCDLNLSDVQVIGIGAANTALILDDGGDQGHYGKHDWNSVDSNGYVIRAGNGDDLFDLWNGANKQIVVAGNGSDTVVIGSYAQHVSLGSATTADNEVYVIDTAAFGGVFENFVGNDNVGTVLIGNVVYVNQNDLTSASVVNGGTGANNWLVVTPGDCDPVCDVNGVIVGVTTGSSDCCTVVMGARVVGFSVVDLNNFCTDAHFVANSTAGLTILGSELGGDCITLNAPDQSYFGNCGPCSNTVTLSTGLVAAADGSTTLSGGGNDTLIISACDPNDTYNFNATGVSVTGFTTVDVYATGTTLTLNDSGYCVNIESNCAGTFSDTLTGGAGDDNFNFYASGTFTGSIDGGGGSNELNIECGSYIDMTAATLNNLAEIDISSNASLTLTSTQIATLDTQPGGFAIFDCETPTSQLVIDVVGADFNLADLHVSPGFEGAITIVSESLSGGGDTIYGGPEDFQTIVLGQGNDWINAGSGNTTIQAGYQSGANSVIFSGNGNDDVQFGTANQTMSGNADTVIGPTTGALTVEIVNCATVNFVGAAITGFTTFTVDDNATVTFTSTVLSAATDPGTINVDSNAFANFTGATISNVTSVDIAGTAEFTLPQLGGLLTNNPGVVFSGSGTLEIEAAGSTSTPSTITIAVAAGAADLYDFTGHVIVDVTADDTVGASTTVDVTALTANSSVLVNANNGFETIDVGNTNATVVVGSGVETIEGGTGYTQHTVFDNAFVAAAGETFDGVAGGVYEFDFNADTNLTAATFNGTGAETINAVILENVTVTLAASDVSGAHAGLNVSNGTVDPTSDAHLDIVLNVPGKAVTSFAQSVLNVGAAVDETIDASTGGDTVTMDEAQIQTAILSGANDLIVFTSNLAATTNDSITSTSGAGTLEVNTSLANFTAFNQLGEDGVAGGGSTIGSGAIQVVQIDASSTGEFNSTQIDGDTVSVGGGGELIINVDEAQAGPFPAGLFSLENASIGPESINANVLLNTGANQGTIVLNDTTGDYQLVAGDGITVVNLEGSSADEVNGGGVGTTLVVNVDETGGNTSWHVENDTVSDFANYADLINGEGATATVNVNVDKDFSTSSIGRVGTIDVTVDTDVVFLNTQLSTFQNNAVVLEGSVSSNLVIDDVSGTFTPVTTTVGALAANDDLTGWTGSITIDAVFSGPSQTIDAHNLDGNGNNVSVEPNIAANGVYIYAANAVNTTITGTDAIGGDHLYGGTGNDTFNYLGVDNTAAGPIAVNDASGDIVNGGGGSNTIHVAGGTTDVDFTVGAAHANTYNAGDILNIGTFNLGDGAQTTVTITAAELRADQVSMGGHVAFTTDGGVLGDNYTIQINAFSDDDTGGNVDLRGITDSAFTVASQTNQASIFVDDQNTGSVTVYGSDNGTTSTSSTDIIEVQGMGDTVLPGTGANLVIYENYNVANSFQYVIGDLGTATAATGSSALAREGDLIRGLANHNGYVDINDAGFNLGSTHVDVTAVAATGTSLSGANGFGNWGVVQDSDVISQSFITGDGVNEKIFATAVANAATDITHFTDGATNSGFITVEDNNHDVALFYVSHNSGEGLSITTADIKLVGVFDTLDGGGLLPPTHTAGTAGVLGSLFFHIHS